MNHNFGPFKISHTICTQKGKIHMEDPWKDGLFFHGVIVIDWDAYSEAIQGLIWRRNEPTAFTYDHNRQNNVKDRGSRHCI